EPVMTGGLFWDGAVTVIENAASVALSTPSLTLIVMPSYVPTSPSPGVPDNCPVDGSKRLHTGPFCSENVRMSPSTSSAVGVNEYSVPAATVAGGVPEIVGGVFTPASRTTIWNGGSVTVDAPSLTAITMSRNVPALAGGGVPSSVPVLGSKRAHAGRLRIVKRSGSPSGSSACGTNR